MKTLISPRLSAALDAARGAAACYVILHHVAGFRGWDHGLGIAFSFGQEAVLVFFLLSGFVIFANEQDRAADLKGYYLRRFRRIYPTLIVAMILSVVVALLNNNLEEKFSIIEMIGTLLSLQDLSAVKPGVLVEPFMGNSPLWSLSYEVAFYAAFPFVMAAWKRSPRITTNLVGLAACLAYGLFIVVPNHWLLVTAYFMVWWCGAMVANAYQNGERAFWHAGPSVLWLTGLCVIAAAAVVLVGYEGLGTYPFLMLRHFASALLIMVVLFGPFGKLLSAGSLYFAKTSALIASISYGLYALHYPLLFTWAMSTTTVRFMLACVVLVALAWLSDRQFHSWLARWTAPLPR